MEGFLDVQSWRDAFVHSFSDLIDGTARYLPLVASAMIILLVGWLVSTGIAWVARGLLRVMGVDRGAARVRLGDALHQAGIAAPLSTILGQLVFFLFMLAFARVAMEWVGLTVVTGAIDSLVAFLPRLLTGGLIMLFGLLIARVAGRLATSAAATARVPQAIRLGGLTHGLLVLIAAVMALERLGVGTEILVNSVTAVVAAATVTMGVAFALGARPIVTHILAGHFLRQSLPGDRVVEFRGRRGMIERIGPVDTVLKGEEQSWSIANAQLLEEVVAR